MEKCKRAQRCRCRSAEVQRGCQDAEVKGAAGADEVQRCIGEEVQVQRCRGAGRRCRGAGVEEQLPVVVKKDNCKPITPSVLVI